MQCYLSIFHLCQILGPWHSPGQENHVIRPLRHKTGQMNLAIFILKINTLKIIDCDLNQVSVPCWLVLRPTCLLASSRLVSGQMTTFLLHWTGSLSFSPATVTAIYRFEQTTQHEALTRHPALPADGDLLLDAIKWQTLTFYRDLGAHSLCCVSS